ncbi:MAG: extracellular solute-binding protein [Lachnospiraceae bacterium]|nr:extracellular solute-binding protein [Lachnospiraceae bacterium]
MRNGTKKLIGTVVFCGAFAGVCVLLNLRGKETFYEKYAGYDLTTDIVGLERTGTYTGYLLEHEGASCPDKTVDIDIFNYTLENGEAEVVNDYHDAAKALYTETESVVTFDVNVPESGYYYVKMDYLIPESRGVQAERSVYINGELPFSDASTLTFSRIWTDGGEVRTDNQGNEIRPAQVEIFDWQTSYLRDDMGYIQHPYTFYFDKGSQTIGFGAESEPMVIKALSLEPVTDSISYSDYIAAGPADTGAGSDYIQIIQGEDSTCRSESSLYAKYDRASPTTQPYSVTSTVLNYTGGESWRAAGQWIEWEFEVPEDGYYNIMIKGRQNYQRGQISARAVYIDGEIPFAEAEAVEFPYKNDWESISVSDADGNVCNFYLTKGTHTIRVESVLGSVGPIIEELEDSTYRLNQIYRRILVFTGANPDQYRDYRIQDNYPEIMDAMELEYRRLYKIVDDYVELTGQKATNIAAAQTVAQQLERFCAKPGKITHEFITFKDNITALGTAMLNLSETKMDIDYIVITGTGTKPPFDKTHFWNKAVHEVKSFISSFIVDYNSVGDVYEGSSREDTIKVWVTTGRDQGTILKTMIDDTFTPETGIKVNVEIVDPNALLNAVLAGRGPDVVLSVGADQPVNYALRHASEDITQFEGWQDVLSHYSESSYEQYRLDDHIYAVPEQQQFCVMFYRKDVLEELGLQPPNTWKELIEMLPTIQGNNLSVGIPTAAGSSTTATASTAVASNMPDLSLYFTLLFQYGGDMYNDIGNKTTVDTEAGVKAFDDYTRYFNDYGLPTIYDFVSRFRSGEMPIGICNYSQYNTLMVSAPEIKGLWDFTLIPGTERVDENGNTYIDRSDFITGNATMMIATDNEIVKQNSWEFMKWWAEPETQVRFGREIEALLGSSARYATANRDAFSQLSWSYNDIQVLNEQWDSTVGIREVPGGYYTGRHIANACRKVINEKTDARETIIDYSILIDDEIDRKRREFGLPVYGEM